MPRSQVNDPEHWRDRAATMRVLAAEIKNAEGHAIMLKLADDYDRLADRAVKRSAQTDPKARLHS
jgi:hypothetical protein